MFDKQMKEQFQGPEEAPPPPPQPPQGFLNLGSSAHMDRMDIDLSEQLAARPVAAAEDPYNDEPPSGGTFPAPSSSAGRRGDWAYAPTRTESKVRRPLLAPTARADGLTDWATHPHAPSPR